MERLISLNYYSNFSMVLGFIGQLIILIRLFFFSQDALAKSTKAEFPLKLISEQFHFTFLRSPSYCEKTLSCLSLFLRRAIALFLFNFSQFNRSYKTSTYPVLFRSLSCKVSNENHLKLKESINQHKFLNY